MAASSLSANHTSEKLASIISLDNNFFRLYGKQAWRKGVVFGIKKWKAGAATHGARSDNDGGALQPVVAARSCCASTEGTKPSLPHLHGAYVGHDRTLLVLITSLDDSNVLTSYWRPLYIKGIGYLESGNLFEDGKEVRASAWHDMLTFNPRRMENDASCLIAHARKENGKWIKKTDVCFFTNRRQGTLFLLMG